MSRGWDRKRVSLRQAWATHRKALSQRETKEWGKEKKGGKEGGNGKRNRRKLKKKGEEEKIRKEELSKSEGKSTCCISRRT